jgi:hypothetical protein
MSWLTAVAGVDPLIAAIRRKDTRAVLSEVLKLIRKYKPEFSAQFELDLKEKGLL